MSAIIIRKATAADLRLIIEMLADDDLGKTRENIRDPLPSAYVRAFKNITADPNQELMVVQLQDGVIAGCFQLTFIPYLTYQGGIRAQIEAVRIHKDHRGKSLGTKMFEWIINRAKEQKAHVLQLTTDKKRPEAIHFYEQLGFTATHEGMKMHF